MKQIMFVCMLSLIFGQGWAAQISDLPVISKMSLAVTSCENNTIFVKFKNTYSAPMYSLFFRSNAISVSSPLTDVLGYILPQGESDVIPITFLEDKKAVFYGEMYLIKKESASKLTDAIEQKCELVSLCECKGPRCEVALLTNGQPCQVHVVEATKTIGTQTNPFVVETR